MSEPTAGDLQATRLAFQVWTTLDEIEPDQPIGARLVSYQSADKAVTSRLIWRRKPPLFGFAGSSTSYA